MSEQVLLLSSGGLDSTTVAYWLAQQGMHVVPLFFDYGQHCAETEWDTLRQVLPNESSEKAVRVSLRDVFSSSHSRLIREVDLWSESIDPDDLYVPYRTMLFFTASAAYAQTVGITKIYSGFINSNHATEVDCSADYLNQMQSLSSFVGPVRHIIPFRHDSKREIARRATKLGVPIGRTFSCQVWHDIPCGACPNCVDRLDAIRSLHLTE